MKKFILVIEDDYDIAAGLSDLLECEGYIVELAQNGKIALEKLSTLTSLPSLILLDLMMPVMDGYEFRKIQQSDHKLSSIPIIVMTADKHIDTKKVNLELDVLLRKPFDVDNLLRVVKSFVQ